MSKQRAVFLVLGQSEAGGGNVEGCFDNRRQARAYAKTLMREADWRQVRPGFDHWSRGEAQLIEIQVHRLHSHSRGRLLELEEERQDAEFYKELDELDRSSSPSRSPVK